MSIVNFPLIPIILLIFCSAFFSATETSLFSLTRFQLRQLKQKNQKLFGQIRYLLDRPAALVATVLLGNECANMLTSNLLTSFYEHFHWPSYYITVINLFTIIPLILIFGEITPKIIAAKANISVVKILFPVFWVVYRLSFPVRFILENIVLLLTSGLKRKNVAEEQIREDDIRVLLEDGKKKGTIHSVEQDMIENVFELDDDNAIELASPIRDFLTVDQNDSPSYVIERLKTNFCPRIPVRDGSVEKIIGILYAKDLLNQINRDDKEIKVKNLMKEPLYIEPNMKAEALFRRFRQLKVHIAVITNKQGKTMAVITMEDLLEQMFGELWEGRA